MNVVYVFLENHLFLKRFPINIWIKKKLQHDSFKTFLENCSTTYGPAHDNKNVEHDGLVECLNRDCGVVGLSLTGGTGLCPWARHFIFCLVMVQLKKTSPGMTKKLLTGM